MLVPVPSDLPPEHHAAYRRGWQDGRKALGQSGGSRTSPVKAASAKANGAKGGRPRKS